MNYTISQYGASLRASTLGAELCSYIDATGQERIWPGQADIWPGHAPVLFPLVGAPKNGEVRFAGKGYPVRKHGFWASLEFTLVEQGANFMLFAAVADEETRASYPYAFAVHILHFLRPDGFTTEFRVQNCDIRPHALLHRRAPGVLLPHGAGRGVRGLPAPL